MHWALLAKCFCSDGSAKERDVRFCPAVLGDAGAVSSAELYELLNTGLHWEGSQGKQQAEEKEHRHMLNICFNYLSYPLFLPQAYKVFTDTSQLRITD